MFRISLSFSIALAACTPPPQDAAMRNSNPAPEIAVSGGPRIESLPSIAPSITRQDAENFGQAAQAPIPEPVSVVGRSAPVLPIDVPAEALGRRILSTAFVRVGPDGYLTVELRDGLVLVLRDVVMRSKKYCGVQALGGSAGARYCGAYADVAAARPGGEPKPTSFDPIEAGRSPSKSD